MPEIRTIEERIKQHYEKWVAHYRKEIVRMIEEMSDAADLERVYGDVLCTYMNRKDDGEERRKGTVTARE